VHGHSPLADAWYGSLCLLAVGPSSLAGIGIITICGEADSQLVLEQSEFHLSIIDFEYVMAMTIKSWEFHGRDTAVLWERGWRWS
jgi:hypothetical protein